MTFERVLFLILACLPLLLSVTATCHGQETQLPAGVKAVWDLEKAYREKTATRERVCLNGLWRWQPAKDDAETVPADGWGYYKVPGYWPAGFSNHERKESQDVYRHDSWKSLALNTVTASFYQREFSVPDEWTGRKILITADTLNSKAIVFIDGKKSGEMRYPGGDVDLTSFVKPGAKHVLSVYVRAVPMNAVEAAFNDTNSERQVKGSVDRKGLCGDVYLCGIPTGAVFTDVKVATSTRKGEITFEAELQGLAANAQGTIRALVTENGRSIKEFTSKPFKAEDLKDGRVAFTEKWKADKLWDTHTPKNMYELQLSLLDAGGKVLDTALPVRFGYREFWIDGRDFYLNGSRIFLSSVPMDNAQLGAAWASYDGAKESFSRLQSFGINFVYAHNYSCLPGSHVSYEEILRAADDVGMLVAMTQPHFGNYNWDSADVETQYAKHAKYFVRVAQNHPSVFSYVMNHNATGTAEDMNPEHIDGIYDEKTPWAIKNLAKADRAREIVMRLDTSRFVYYHSSGNANTMHTSNFYPNWTPVQELSDWFEHWGTKGVKPVFTCEYGAPFGWDFTMYRGWWFDPKTKKPLRAFGNGQVPWEFCVAEWCSQFYGDPAFKISEQEKVNLRFEAKNMKAGKEWFRWDYPHEPGSKDFDEQYPIFAMYLTDNWRAYRTWGVSANSPWEHHIFWKARPNANKARKNLTVDWENLQRPGFSADFTEGGRHERFEMSFERSEWAETPAAAALVRNNRPLLAYIGGKAAAFTSKDHNFRAGESVEKQIIIINNSRETAACECEWSLNTPQALSGNRKASVKTGEQERVAMRFDLPSGLAAGSYEITASVKFGSGETQKDTFALHVLPQAQPVRSAAKIALFDPKGETKALLTAAGVNVQAVDASADLSGFDTLIVGKGALSVTGAGIAVNRVRDGLKVILFEQTGEVLEQRFGFRVAEYGLRQVFKRVPDHPILAGLSLDHLRDWRGEATILPSRLNYRMSPELSMAPAVKWCGIEVSRCWRGGNRGNVASALIEKPACGDFTPIIDGGYSLQYSPLMEYREGKGMIVFCQMDICGRTESDPAGETLLRNILQYVSAWKPAPARTALYAGDAKGRKHLTSAGFTVAAYEGGNLSPEQVLIIGPGGGKQLAASAANIESWLKAGGNLLAVGLDGSDTASLPVKVAFKPAEHIAAFFEPTGKDTLFAGLGPADVHNRDPRVLPLVTGGAQTIGNGVLAKAENANAVFCQLVPWTFEYKLPQNIKRTFRRSSCTLTRLLGNMGVAGTTPILDRFRDPADANAKRWLTGLYLDTPEAWDDPYRFFRW